MEWCWVRIGTSSTLIVPRRGADVRCHTFKDTDPKIDGKTGLCIYEVEGDTLKWAANDPGEGNPRPKAFPKVSALDAAARSSIFGRTGRTGRIGGWQRSARAGAASVACQV